MKKKKIFLTASIFSLFTLASCVSQNNTNTTLDRGTTDNSDNNITIPDAIKPSLQGDKATYTVIHKLENKDGKFESIYTEVKEANDEGITEAKAREYTGYTPLGFTQENVKEDGSTVIEIRYEAKKYVITLDMNSFDNDSMAVMPIGMIPIGGIPISTTPVKKFGGTVAGDGEYSILDGDALLTARTYIGYDFIGWYDGDKLLSEDKNYSLKVNSDMNITGKFMINPKFSDFKFSSTFNGCTINGYHGEVPSDLVIPEGVTDIAYEAFEYSGIRTIVFPSTLKYINSQAFYSCCGIYRLTFKSIPSISSDAFEYCNPIEIYNLSDTQEEIPYVYAPYVYYGKDIQSKVVTNSDGFYYYAMNGYCYLLGSTKEDLKKLVLPDTITIDGTTYDEYIISEYAFYNKGIQCLTIPNSVIKINDSAFYKNTKLYEVFNYSDLDIYKDSYYNGYAGYYAKYIHTSNEEPVIIQDGDISYEIQNDSGTPKAVIVDVDTNSENIVINAIEGYDTVIAENAFKNNTNVKTITLGEGVTEIKDYAFYECSNLESIDLSKVKRIGRYAFYKTKLKSIDMPICEEIGDCAFEYCYYLQDINMPSIEYIGSNAFYECYSLYQIELPKTLESIDYYAFEDCYRLKEIINNSNLSITAGDSSNGYVAYYAYSVVNDKKDSKLSNNNGFITYLDSENNKNILVAYVGNSKSITIPSNITEISSYAFTYCDFESVKIPSGVNYNSAMFNSCNISKLSIYLTDDDTSKCNFNELFNSSSYGYVYFDDLIIEGDITTIPEYYFQNINTSRISLPKSLKYVESYGFGYSFNADVYFDGTLLDWISIEFSGYYSNPAENSSIFAILDENGDLEFNNKKYIEPTELIIPEGITEIAESQFRNARYSRIVIPEGVTSIGTSAFYGCSRLEEIVLPSTLKYIGNKAFESCNKLKSITLPDSLESIGQNAFAYSGIVDIKVPESVTDIGIRIFYNCKSLVVVDYKAHNLPESTFQGCINLQKVNLNENITSINDYTFYGCKYLRKITLPDNISSIGGCAFSGCKNLSNINIPDSVTLIDSQAFEETGIKSISLKNLNISTLEYGVFENCSKLESIELPSTITTIDSSVFYGCSSLKSIEIPEGVTSIGNYAFEDCESLKNIEIKGNITSIGSDAFYNCNAEGFNIDNGGYYLGNGDNDYYYLVAIDSNTTECSIKNECKIMAKSLFNHASELLKLELPESFIDYSSNEEMLIGCTKLEEITFNSCNQYAYRLFNKTSYKMNTIKKVILKQVPSGDSTYKMFYDFAANEIEVCEGITSLANFTFYGCTATKYTLPSTLKSISYEAFEASSIKELDLSNMQSGATLGNSLFKDCKSLKSVILPSDLSYIYNSMFSGCTALESIKIPSTVTSIYASAFSGCSKLKNVEFSNNITSIMEYAFGSCTSLEEVIIPDKVTKLADNAFNNCTGLKTVVLPPKLTSIGTNAFYNCTKLINVVNLSSLNIVAGASTYGYVGYWAKTIHSSLDEQAVLIDIDDYSFLIDGGVYLYSYNGTATDLVLPESIEYNGTTYTEYAIDKYVFKSKNITSVVIPNSVTAIGEEAFYQCSLKSLTVPESVKRIDDNAFYGNDISSLVFEGDTMDYIGENAFTYNKMKSVTLPGTTKFGTNAFYNCTLLETVIMKDGTTALSTSMFNNCSVLKNVTLPSTLETIGQSAFYNNYKLTEITIPSSVKSIGQTAFRYSGLTSITIPNDSVLESIGKEAFKGLDITSINLPDSLKTIGNEAFYQCSALSEVTIPSSVTTNIGKSVFGYCTSLEKVIYNSSVTGTYMFDQCSALKEVEFSNYVTTIAEGMFRDCKKLSTINMPTSLQQIDYAAFSNTSITSIVIPKSVTTINNTVFYNCSELLSVEFEEGSTIDRINTSVFNGCSKLTDVTLPNSIIYINQSAFNNCKSLKNINIPTKLKFIGQSAFYMCGSLTTLELPNTVTNIGDSAFSYMPMEEFVVPGSIKSLGTYVFQNCSNLKKVTINAPTGASENISLNERLFQNCVALEDVILNGNIYTIGSYVFQNCKALKNVFINGNVTNLYNNSFDSSAIENLYIVGDVSTISNNAFSSATITNVFFKGNVSSMGSSGNTAYTNATKYYYSEDEPESAGNYWHYDDSGVPTIWS